MIRFYPSLIPYWQKSKILIISQRSPKASCAALTINWKKTMKHLEIVHSF
ncbi:hypothetical protein HZS_1199 [Henneguya salminicola]|nr:hypothetical protein HZS_1199 [Henneguya salminicola]